MAAEQDPVPPHVIETVESIATMHTKALAGMGRHQRSIEWLTAKLARPSSLYVIVAGAGVWVWCNLFLLATGGRTFDPPPFPGLQGLITLAALLMTTMVLTAQNRQTRHAEQRAQLDLQVNLLVDAKVTKLISLVEELRRDMPSVPNRFDRVAEEMAEKVDPGRVLSALEQSIENKGNANETES